MDEYHVNTLEGPQINKVYHHIDDLLETVTEQDEKCVKMLKNSNQIMMILLNNS